MALTTIVIAVAVTAITSVLVMAVTGVTVFMVVSAAGYRARSARTVPPIDQVDLVYHAARHAMNDAAGQSWRNLID